jgi:flagellin
MKINYNVSAMLTNNALSRNDSALAKSIERLSSGYKINSAKDNAAGLAMSRRMNAQIRGLSVASDNANDGISIVEIADGALSEVHDILQRMNELAVKSSNGTLSDNDREMIDEELQSLKAEADRIGSTTQFNGQNLLDGSFDLKGYSSSKAVSVDSYTESMKTGEYTLKIDQVEYDGDGKLKDGAQVTLTDPEGKEVTGLVASVKDDVLTLTGKEDFELKLTLNKDYLTEDQANPGQYAGDGDITLNLTGIGAMTIQIGANEGQTLDLRIPAINQKNMGINNTDVLTADSALSAIDEISGAISYISSVRSSLGAYQNRLEHTTSNLDVSSENMTSAYSRVMDVDMATEMTTYSSLQVISQAATSMLAQANERPSQVLQLLQ